MTTTFEGITLKKGEIRYEKTRGPVQGAQAEVESGADLQNRYTVGSVLLRGVIFAKKKVTGHVYLTVRHPEYEFVVEVPAKKDGEARKFAAAINSASRV